MDEQNIYTDGSFDSINILQLVLSLIGGHNLPLDQLLVTRSTSL